MQSLVFTKWIEYGNYILTTIPLWNSNSRICITSRSNRLLWWELDIFVTFNLMSNWYVLAGLEGSLYTQMSRVYLPLSFYPGRDFLVISLGDPFYLVRYLDCDSYHTTLCQSRISSPSSQFCHSKSHLG